MPETAAAYMDDDAPVQHGVPTAVPRTVGALLAGAPGETFARQALNLGEALLRPIDPPPVRRTPPAISPVDAFGSLTLREARHVLYRLMIDARLRRFEGNVTATAKSLGMERTAFGRVLAELEIDFRDYRPLLRSRRRIRFKRDR